MYVLNDLIDEIDDYLKVFFVFLNHLIVTLLLIIRFLNSTQFLNFQLKLLMMRI